MRRYFTLLLLLGCTLTLVAQDNEMIIEPGPPGIIEQTIFGDTTETGERANPNRIYILKRATPYLTAQRVRWGDYHIHLKAEDGDGVRPLIMFSPSEGGGAPSELVRTNSGAHLTLEGIHITGKDVLGNIIMRLFRVGGDSTRLVFDDCIVEESSQTGIRCDASGIKMYITNSIWNRMGQPTNANNGRMIDTRGNPIDTVWVENSVVYDVTSRMYWGNGGSLHYGRFNQNTFYACGQHGFDFTQSDNLMFTNNIFAEPLFLGVTDSSITYAMSIDTVGGDDNIDISYNNIYVSDEFAAALPELALSDTLRSGKDFLFGPTISAVIASSASATTNISETLDFTDAPNIPTQFINAYSVDSTARGDGVVQDAGEWDFSDLSPDDLYSGISPGYDRYVVHHDFSYPESAQSYTAGSEGQKLGADLSNIDTDVEEDYFISDRILYYPNPVREELFVQNLDQSKLSSISIYNLMGQRLLHQDVRNLHARFQLGALPSGTYVLTVRDQQGKVSSRKISKR